ncbi:hypothetical protein TorRG33x02_357340, partial [Trema orientale]
MTTVVPSRVMPGEDLGSWPRAADLSTSNFNYPIIEPSMVGASREVHMLSKTLVVGNDGCRVSSTKTLQHGHGVNSGYDNA